MSPVTTNAFVISLTYIARLPKFKEEVKQMLGLKQRCSRTSSNSPHGSQPRSGKTNRTKRTTMSDRTQPTKHSRIRGGKTGDTDQVEMTCLPAAVTQTDSTSCSENSQMPNPYSLEGSTSQCSLSLTR